MPKRVFRDGELSTSNVAEKLGVKRWTLLNRLYQGKITETEAEELNWLIFPDVPCDKVEKVKV